MPTPNIRLFGPRIALIEVEDTLEGSIELPQTKSKVMSLGKITHAGDGKIYIPAKKWGTYTPDVEEMLVSVGDIVMFQLPPHMLVNMTYQIGDKGYVFILQSDAIARLSSTVCKIENFEILGRYILCTRERTQVTAGGIHLPDIVEDYNDDHNHFKAVQVGSLVSKCVAGDQLVVDRSRANEIRLSGDTYYFIDEIAVHGVIDDANVTGTQVVPPPDKEEEVPEAEGHKGKKAKKSYG